VQNDGDEEKKARCDSGGPYHTVAPTRIDYSKLTCKRHAYQERDDEPTQVQAYFDSENASEFDMRLHLKFRVERVAVNELEHGVSSLRF